MAPYYHKVYIPFTIEEYINLEVIETLNINLSITEDNYVRKDVLSKDILNYDFCAYVENIAQMKIGKILLWHWRITNPNVAHVDCDVTGVISPHGAFNWTYSTEYSSVQWYDVPFKEQLYMGNEFDKKYNFNTPTSYIPVPNIDMTTKDDEWDDQGPAIINTSIPHMIYAPNTRVSVSLQFAGLYSFNDLYERFKNVS